MPSQTVKTSFDFPKLRLAFCHCCHTVADGYSWFWHLCDFIKAVTLVDSIVIISHEKFWCCDATLVWGSIFAVFVLVLWPHVLDSNAIILSFYICVTVVYCYTSYHLWFFSVCINKLMYCFFVTPKLCLAVCLWLSDWYFYTKRGTLYPRTYVLSLILDCSENNFFSLAFDVCWRR